MQTLVYMYIVPNIMQFWDIFIFFILKNEVDVIYHTINMYNQKYFSADLFSYSPCHYMRAWIRVLDEPSCYEHVVRVERKSALQGSGLVRTVGSCAQRRVALIPWAIAIARDALLNDWHESAMRFERPAK